MIIIHFISNNNSHSYQSVDDYLWVCKTLSEAISFYKKTLVKIDENKIAYMNKITGMREEKKTVDIFNICL